MLYFGIQKELLEKKFEYFFHWQRTSLIELERADGIRTTVVIQNHLEEHFHSNPKAQRRLFKVIPVDGFDYM